MHRRSIRLALVLGGLAVSVVFGYLAIRGVEWNAAWRAFLGSNGWWVVPSLLALAASVVVRIVRWRALFRPGRRPPFGALTKAGIVGLFFNNLLPARAGEAARILALKRYAETPLAETTATVVVERVLDLASLLLLLFVLLPWLPHVSWLAAAGIVAAVALAGIAVFIIAVLLLRSRPDSAAQLLSRVPGVSEARATAMVQHGLLGLETLVSPRQAAGVLGWTYASWLLLGLSFWSLMRGFHLDLSLLAGLLVVIATGLAFIVPAAPAAVGVFEAAGLTALAAYGVTRSQAFACVLVLHVLNFAPFVLAGIAVLALDESLRVAPTAIAVRSRRS